MSHFFAYLSRMKYIYRWGLMRNTLNENIQEHSLQVAMVAHSLAVIRNRLFGGNLDSGRITTLAVFHEVSEVITGDIATPIKYFNPEIKKAYKEIETIASRKLLRMLPGELEGDYAGLLVHAGADGADSAGGVKDAVISNTVDTVNDPDEENRALVKVADKICAYLKCVEELKAGNQEFIKAEKAIKAEIDGYGLPEVKYFMDNFLPSFMLTLDELN